ncbi:MAG: UDP-N-acetylmuramate dehydrogenase [Bacteroidota bacterium]|nr:UDP-N-acetylmuramate dehydrogenase [Bacteroidota bacterium]
MIRFEENFSLIKYNTFGIEAHSRYFFEFTESEDLRIFIQNNETLREENQLILGGGSNYLFTSDFKGIIFHPNIPGIRVLDETATHIWIEAGAGEEWDQFIEYCVNKGYGGVENLSLIPGKIGATPVQNIGAYGIEASQVIDTVYGIDLTNGERVSLSASDCHFGYRDSIFKHDLKGKIIVTSVVFKLSRFPEFKLGYGAVKAEVERLGEVSLRNIRTAVINIRHAKLPDPKELGSAGSFFMNPVVDTEIAERLKSNHPNMPSYQTGEGKTKLAAGWLIEQCGWKGFRDGDTGVHKDQSLVLVNYGKASGMEIYNLSEKIKVSVYEKFGIELNREVIVI